MLATPSAELPQDERDWAFEFKWDGVRALAYAEEGELRIYARTGREITAAYPEVQVMTVAMHGREAVLDGEIVSLDERGRPSFEALQARMHVSSAAKVRRLAEEKPVAYVIFDVLHIDGTSTLDSSYRERRGLLESLELSGPNWHVPPFFEKDGAELFEVSKEQGLEGIICKRLDSLYAPGRRTRDWLKVKHERTQEVVIGGWSPGSGRRLSRIGSLLIGVYDDSKLLYAGRVGSGFSEAALDELQAQLTRIERPTPAFSGELPRAETRNAHWVEPRLVGEVRFGEWTVEGRLRQPVWRGLRGDKRPREVKRES